MKYHLRLIDSDPWVGVRKYEGCSDGIGPDVGKHGDPVTGLTGDRWETDEKGRRTLVPGTQTMMEKILRLKEGELDPKSPFWDMFEVRVDSDDKILDDTDPQDQLALLFLRAQSDVANSMAELKTKASARFVIFSPEEEAEINAKRKSVKREAYRLFDRLSTEDYRDILSLYGVSVESLSDAMVIDRLQDELETSPRKFMAIVSDPNRQNKQFVKRCMHKGIIRIEDGAFMFNDVTLGFDEISTVFSLFSGEHRNKLSAIEMALGQRVDGTIVGSNRREPLDSDGQGGLDEVDTPIV